LKLRSSRAARLNALPIGLASDTLPQAISAMTASALS